MQVTMHAAMLVQLLAQAGLRADVSLHAQVEADDDITVWPYASAPDGALRNVVPRIGSPDGKRATQPWVTHALLLPATLEAYDRAVAQVLAHPVMQGTDGDARVEVEALPMPDLAALLRAAALPWRIGLPVAVRGQAGIDAR